MLVTVCPKPIYISGLIKVLALKSSQSRLKSAPALPDASHHCPTNLQGFCVSLPCCLQARAGQDTQKVAPSV